MSDLRYMLDTNICIYLLNDGSDKAAQRLAECDAGSVAMSAIVYAELMAGASRSINESNRVAALVKEVIPIDFHAEAAARYGTLSTGKSRRHAFDRLIAAHAIALGVTLVTNNPRDFESLEGLSLENWAG